MQTVILPPPRNRDHVVDYARAVKSCLDGSGISQFTHLSIRLPIYLPSAASIAASNSLRLSNGSLPSPISVTSFASSSHAASSLSEAELNATWEMWDTIRSLCGYNPRLSLSEHIV
jgi:protein arginine N-methyltransferase 5